MAGSLPSASLPHALQVAHEHLCAELRQGIDSFQRNLRYANYREILLAVERFVGELCRVPAWREELERCAGLVESSCGPGAEFRRAMGAAWKAYRNLPKKPFGPKLSGEKLAFSSLRKAESQPTFLAQVVQIRQELERTIDSGFLGRRVKAAFKDWLDRCRAIQREAERLEVDGCWYLYHIYQAAQPSPSDAAERAKAMVHSGDLGGGTLEWMLAAGDSLVAWIREKPEPSATVNPPSEAGNGQPDTPAEPANASPSARKSKRSTERGEARVKLIAALTKHHKYADGGCLNTEPIGCNRLAGMAEVSRSTASAFFKKEFGGHTQYKVVCRDPGRLAESLKVLSNDFSPQELYGRNPPKEGNRGDDE